MINLHRTMFFILIIALWLSVGFSKDYLWPTNASTYMSSSFCEFRDGHYHSAIDIKTWLREGYPVYAIEDGFIERIRISPFGYGKVLYLRLNDGNIAVYAHLQRFTKEIDRKIRKKQLQNQKYRIDWRPNSINVKKGDIIAYTGCTGTGLPHLHFEIRNKKNNPINPQAFYPQIKDEIRPRLQKIAIIPISRDATINSTSLPKIFPLTYIKDGIYVIKEPLKTKGKIGIAIKGYDQADGVSNKYGFYQTIMEVGGKEVFGIKYDLIHFSTTSHIFTETYYPFWADSEEVFHKLYIERFNPLHFYREYENTDGTIYVHNKPVDFSIFVSDFHGNQSQIRGELVPENSQLMSLQNEFSQTSVSIDDTLANTLKVKLHYIGDNLIFETNNYLNNSRIRILPPLKEFNLRPLPEGKCQGILAGNMLTTSNMNCQLYSNEQLVWSKDVNVARIVPNIIQQFSWFDSTFSIEVSKGAFLDTVLVTANRISPDSLRMILPLASDIYEIHPSNIPLFDQLLVQITPDTLPTWGKWSLYGTDGNKSVSFLTSTFNRDSTVLQTKTKRLGKFVIASDTIAPNLEILSPKSGVGYKNNPRIVIDLYDEHSGIGVEENISILIDGNFVLPEWDPEEKSVIAYLDENLSKGNHILTVSVNDRCGNIKSRAVYFSIL